MSTEPRPEPQSAPAAEGISREVNFGFESVVAGSGSSVEWDEIVSLLDAAGATGVSLAVGRPDWVAFPWAEHPKSVSTQVQRDDADHIRTALEELPDRLDVTLTIDAFAPRMLAEYPELAGADADGEASESFAAVSALDGGRVGDRIVDLASHLAQEYQPERIALTELMFDDATFSEEDLAHFRRHTGESDWPRLDSGDIDTDADIIAQWRSESLTRLLERVADAVHEHGVAVDMDVRAPQDDPDSDRRLSGHNYEMLLDAADRLVVWNYPGLSSNDGSVAHSGEVSRILNEKYPERIVISTGLWADGDSTLSPKELAEVLRVVEDAGATAVSVTPASMLSDRHWDALIDAWQ